MKARRVCPPCGSVATRKVDGLWSCARCGHTAKAFPEAHAQVDPSPARSDRVYVGGGYMRRSPFTAFD